jgi:hypothetical protein
MAPKAVESKPRPMDGVRFIAYAIETLRDEAHRNAASTPPVEAICVSRYPPAECWGVCRDGHRTVLYYWVRTKIALCPIPHLWKAV